jgi:V/A-type H+-transporting ATPase subunit E
MRPVEPDHSAASETAVLVDSIREQAAAEVAETMAQGDKRAARIASAAVAEVDEIRAGARCDGEDRGRRQAAKLLAAAEAESRRRWLCDREALIDEAIRRARQRLGDFAKLPRAREQLVELIREGLQVLPPGAVRIYLPEDCLLLLDDALRARLAAERWTLRFEAARVVSGGVIMEAEDGRLRFDNSFDARIRRRIRRLRRAVADVLFAAEASDTRGANSGTRAARPSDGVAV